MDLGIKYKIMKSDEIRQLLVDKAEIPLRLFVAANLKKEFPINETTVELTDDAEITVTHITEGKREKKLIALVYPSEKQVLKGFLAQQNANGKLWIFQISTGWIEFFNNHALEVLKDVETSNNNNNIQETTVPTEGN
jgi:hypothetical protein